jgi:2-methylisocitrate lyase-like PEP mutase family enzyme
MTQAEKAERFRALHEGEPFVIPNPWDAGSARVLEQLGFQALATTSSGFAFTLGRSDGEATLDDVVAHVESLTAASQLPVSVDLENAYEDPAETMRRIGAAGAVGGSIEDWDGNELYDVGEALARLKAALEGARSHSFPFTLTARAENHIRGNPDLDDTIARLQAYEAAGADVLYAPGLKDVDEIRTVCDAVTKPVNVHSRPNLTASEIFDAGAQRISVGGALTWVVADALTEAAKAILDGDLSSLDKSSPF